MDQDRLAGTLKQGKGKLKEEAGKLVGDRSTEWSGKLDQAKGKLQEKVGEVKDSRRRPDRPIV